MLVLELRKNCIIFNMVMVTNVFSSDGISCWKVFSFMSLCGSRLMDSQLAFSFRIDHRNGFNYQGLCGSSPIFLGLPLLLGGAVGEASGCFLFLASASAVLVFFSSEAVDRLFGFEPVILVGKTMGSASCLGARGSVTMGFFFCLAAMLGSMPGRPRALRFSASL